MTFTNKKPTLFGEGENSIGIIDTPAIASKQINSADSHFGEITTPAIAGLDGTSSTLIDSEEENTNNGDNQQYSPTRNGSFVNFSSNQVLSTIIMTRPSIKSKLILVVTVKNTDNASSNSFNIRRNNIELKSFDTPAQANIIFVEVNTFDETKIDSGTATYTVNGLNNGRHSGVTLTGIFVDISDTHAGVITSPAIPGLGGSPEDSVAIISTPATATKDIITPDSHVTRAGVNQ